jgi:NAD(P)-dependent dehydrogenase (short-subunit alcohol dehydrogenase family)
MRLSLAAVAAAGAAAAVAAYRRRRPEDDLAGEVALVTGASRGLGLLIATELARRGCRLLLCARDGAELERAADRLRSTGAQVGTVACDVTREESPGQLVDAAREDHGSIVGSEEFTSRRHCDVRRDPRLSSVASTSNW